MSGFDVSDPEAWEHIGSVDLACLNAGVITGDDDITELTDEQYRRAVGVNVDGVVYGVRRLDRVMPKGSTIVVTASLAGLDRDSRRPDLRPDEARRRRLRAVGRAAARRARDPHPGGVPRLGRHGAHAERGSSRSSRSEASSAHDRRRRRGSLGGVQERRHGRGVDRPARPRAAALRVQGRPRPALAAQWQRAEPVSVKEPTAGRKRHAYASGAERELENAEARRVTRLAVRLAFRKSGDLVRPSRRRTRECRARGRGAHRVLRGESLVAVIVTGEDEIGVRVDERLQERGVRRVAAVSTGRVRG